MATKPTVSFSIATNELYAAGPFIGSLTKNVPPVADGYVPGVEVDASHHNYTGNIAGLWSAWNLAGSYSADLDAHPMETDGTGITAVGGIVLGGTAAAYGPLTITANSGYATAAATITQLGGGSAVIGLSDDAAAGIRGICTGTGPGVEGQTTGGTGPAIKGTGNATGVGGEFTGGVSGTGLTATGGSTSGNGIEATCTDGAGYGVLGTSSDVLGSYGLRGTAFGEDAGGVIGVGHATASPTAINAAAVTATATTGAALWASSLSGPAVVVQGDSGSPDYAALRLMQQNADPTAGSNGDIYSNSLTDNLKAHVQDEWCNVHTSPKGFTHAFSTPATGTINLASFTTVTSSAIAAPNLPSETGTVIVTARLTVRNTAAALNQVVVAIYDTEAGDDVVSDEIFLAMTLAEVTVNTRPDAYERSITVSIPYTLPNTDPRTFELNLAKGSASTGSGFAYKDAYLEVRGVY